MSLFIWRVWTSAFTRMQPGEDISVVCCARSRRAVLCRQPNKQDLFQKCTWVPTSTNSYQLSTIVIQSLLIPTNLASVLILVVQSVIETERWIHFCQSPVRRSFLHGNMLLNNVGIKGSKPGAAAVGVMMANRVSIYESFSFSNVLKNSLYKTAQLLRLFFDKTPSYFSGSCVISS